jgi:hypothetical protein
MMRKLLVRAGAVLLGVMITSAALADPASDIVGDYELVAAKTVPNSKWGYAKARVAIRSLGHGYLSIVLACGWRDIPTSVCSERYYARQRDGAIYLQDDNTFALNVYFDPASRHLTFVSRGFDAAHSVRYETYAPTVSPLTDPDLIRRMRKEQRYADEYLQPNPARKLGKLTFTDNRIEFQSSY